MRKINEIASLIKGMTYSEIIEFSAALPDIVVPIYDAELPEVIAKNLIDWCDKINSNETVE